MAVVMVLVGTGVQVDAAEALRLGLIDEVTETGKGLARARELALRITARAPIAVQIAKLLVNAAEGEEGSAGIEVLAGALAATTQDAREGVQAFRDKRPPEFSNR